MFKDLKFGFAIGSLIVFILFIVFFFVASARTISCQTITQSKNSNLVELQPKPVSKSVLLIILDDIGGDQMSFHPLSAGKLTIPYTPTIDSLSQDGVTFNNAWSMPRCSPTRASILTGQFPTTHGLGDIVETGPYQLPLTDLTIAEVLSIKGYDTAFFGKWHLSTNSEDPCDQGFRVWKAGSIANIEDPSDYYNWERVDDTNNSTTVEAIDYNYNPTVVTDTTINWLQKRVDNKFFAVISYHLGHKPIHCPPFIVQEDCDVSTYEDQHKWMIEAVDMEISRLISSIDRQFTTVIIVGDNGTHQDFAIQGKSKGTVYRTGIEVPLIFWGATVDQANQNGTILADHANVVDLYATIYSLLVGKTPPANTHSKSLYNNGIFSSFRCWNYSERFTPNGSPFAGPHNVCKRAVEEGEYKLIIDMSTYELYNIEDDLMEENDLLLDGTSTEEQSIIDSLLARINELEFE